MSLCVVRWSRGERALHVLLVAGLAAALASGPVGGRLHAVLGWAFVVVVLRVCARVVLIARLDPRRLRRSGRAAGLGLCIVLAATVVLGWGPAALHLPAAALLVLWTAVHALAYRREPMRRAALRGEPVPLDWVRMRHPGSLPPGMRRAR